MRRVCNHHSSAETALPLTTTRPLRPRVNPLPQTASFIPERHTHTWYARPSATLAMYVRAVGHMCHAPSFHEFLAHPLCPQRDTNPPPLSIDSMQRRNRITN